MSTKEQRQAEMTAFGAAVLEADMFGKVVPVLAKPLKSPAASKPSAAVARAAAAHRRAVAVQAMKIKSAVRKGTMTPAQGKAALAKARASVPAVMRRYVRPKKVHQVLSQAGPQAPGADPATALVKAPTLYTRRLSEEEEELLREDSPEIEEKFRKAIEKLKAGSSKRGRTMMGAFGASNDNVIRAWGEGVYAQSGSMRTDGKDLWSYNLKIGTTKRGKKVVTDYTGKFKVSSTTSTHVNKAKQIADKVALPPALLEAFGGMSREDYRDRGFRAMKAVLVARAAGHTVGHPLNPYHGGGWQEDAFDDGVEQAKFLWKRAKTMQSDLPMFGSDLLAEEEALWAESYVDQFGYDDAQQWAYDKAHGGTRWGPRSMGGGYGTFGNDY